ncbi:MAG: hypothetical protein SGARI_006005, partial [Bacillariaceae sp.]
MEHASYLASQASQLCAIGGMRSLSTAALMGTQDALWLVDATGAYRVRACAVGGGVLAGQVNNYLQKQEWTTMTSKDVVMKLLLTMYHDIRDDKTDSSKPRDMTNDENDEQERISVPKGSVVEMMTISKEGKMSRLFSSTLFGRSSVGGKERA